MFLSNWVKNEYFLAILFIIVIAAITFLPLSGQMGYYKDDWHATWAEVTHGVEKIFDMHKVDRPFMGLTYAATHYVLGENPVIWYVYAVFLRVLGAGILLGILRILWPREKIATAIMAALFLIYPGFLQLPNANIHQNLLFGLNFGFLSVFLSLKAINYKRTVMRWLIIGLAMLLAFPFYLIMEWMIGLEVVRFTLLAYLHFLDGEESKYKTIFLKAIKQFLPYLFTTSVFMIWRIFIFKSARQVTDFGTLAGKYVKDPFGMGVQVLVELFRDIIETTFSAWWVPFYDLTYKIDYGSITISILLSVLSIGTFLLYLKWVKNGEVNSDPGKEEKWYLHAMIIGALTIVVTLLPVILANRPLIFEDTFDRYTLVASMGVAMLFVGAGFALLNMSQRKWFFSALIAISIITHFNNSVQFSKAWDYQKQLWWQLSWRAPDLKDGTVLLPLLPQGYRLADSYEIWGPANLIYHPLPGPIRISGESVNNETLFNILNSDNYGRTFRRMPLTIDMKNSLVLSIPGHEACLHIQDQDNPELSEYEDPIIRLIAGKSNLDLIEIDTESHSPPQNIFGKEPMQNWCYYYQKASLARQREDWQEIVRLGDEAREMGFAPADVSEWMPFYEGYARVNRMDEANEIGTILREHPYFINPYCDQRKEFAKKSMNEIEAYLLLNLCPL
ncbi:MAG: hypothetical protein JEZ06_15605 [Anaerolineaceae bacterium]|nr:hypothetical protein [Anaerolineaceae bacterium]